MKRRNFLLGLATAATLANTAGAASSATYADDVVKQLARLGFRDITVETTLLGRIKITAARRDGMREIVLNPRTGEILRDVWYPTDSAGQGRSVLNDIEDDDDNSGSGDDDDDDDNSGHGGGDDNDGDKDDDNSGPGGGGDDDRDDRDDE